MAKKKRRAKRGAKREQPAQFTAALQVSASLGALLGPHCEPPVPAGRSLRLPRSEATKVLWRYIKAKSLQDPADGRRVLFSGDAMGRVLGATDAGMTDMPRLLAPHLRSVSSAGASASAGARASAAADAAADVGPLLEMSPAFSALAAAVQADPPARVSRKAALRLVGKYAAARSLRDGCTIRCNNRLKALFSGRDSVHVSEVGPLVDRHLRAPPVPAPRFTSGAPPRPAAAAAAPRPAFPTVAAPRPATAAAAPPPRPCPRCTLENSGDAERCEACDHSFAAAKAEPAPAAEAARAPREPEPSAATPVDSSCTICLDSAKNSVFVPCGHMCACISCATALKRRGGARCPICRAAIASVVRVFQS